MPATAAASRTLLGFDHGRLRIGVAVGQELTGTARPLVTLAARQQRPDWEGIGRLIEEWHPQLLVVGLPRHADGSDSDSTRAARRFANQLQGRFRLPVECIDERLSSREAEARLREEHHRSPRPGELDRLAAALILESWFNRSG
ncbi:MAG: Holliday junction resolvase RuvX [Candidatus Competibacteraceae bacterium]|nr:Holliday junction resolvase RuvX [Candidatus Competibacteraceae bacterium]